MLKQVKFLHENALFLPKIFWARPHPYPSYPLPFRLPSSNFLDPLLHCDDVYLLQEFSQADYDDLSTGWNNKIHRCAIGDQKWGLFYAEKPTAK